MSQLERTAIPFLKLVGVLRSQRRPQVSAVLAGPSPSEYAVEILFDHEVEQWSYTVDELNIIGTGCLTREDAQRYALEAIEFVLEEEDA